MRKQHSSKCCTNDKIMVAGSNTIPRECDCDGYHTFEELYNHRITLYIAMLRCMSGRFMTPWRSKKHSDENEWDGWFILGYGTTPGEQITYHLPLSRWNETNFAETLKKAPEWDGHTSEDVLERLKNL